MSDWIEDNLGNLAKIEIGGTPSRDIEAFWASENANGYPWVSIADLGSRYVSTTRERITSLGVLSSNVKPVGKGTLLMSFKLTIGRAGIADCDLFTNEAIAAVVPDQQTLDSNFLYYLLPPIARRAVTDTAIKGSTLNKQTLARLKLCFPTNVGDQHRIAEILSTLDEMIEQTEALIAKYQQIKAGLMHDLFTRGLTPEGHLRPTRAQAPHLYKESPLGWIPKEWKMASVKDCGSVQLGRQRSPDQMSGRWTMPYLRVANVFDGYIDYEDVLEMDFTHDERRTFSLKQGDILLNEGQSLELVGRSALYDGQDGYFCFQNTLVRFRSFDEQCPHFYRFLFKWFLDCGLFMRIAKQTTSVAHLGADRFARMRCVSVPYNEQLRIAGRLGAVQARLDSETAHATKLQRQKQGLMQDLLTGRVRVKVSGEATTSAR